VADSVDKVMRASIIDHQGGGKPDGCGDGQHQPPRWRATAVRARTSLVREDVIPADVELSGMRTAWEGA
jgi:hypothetical protein